MNQDNYDAIPGMNWSRLKLISVSPLLYQWRLTNPEPPKPSFVFGGAVHCAVLEPEHFEARYSVFEGTRRGKEWEAWQEARPGVQALYPNELKKVRAIVGALEKGVSPAHKTARRLLQGGRREEALTWTDAETGIKCKGRLDYIRPDFLIDLKTTASPPAPLPFGTAAARFGYAAQLTYYNDGAHAARRIPGTKSPWIIALQSAEPYDCACYELDAPVLTVGRRLYRRLLRLFVQCTESGLWPGVAPDPMPLMLPRWAEEEGLQLTEENMEEF